MIRTILGGTIFYWALVTSAVAGPIRPAPPRLPGPDPILGYPPAPSGGGGGDDYLILLFFGFIGLFILIAWLASDYYPENIFGKAIQFIAQAIMVLLFGSMAAAMLWGFIDWLFE